MILSGKYTNSVLLLLLLFLFAACGTNINETRSAKIIVSGNTNGLFPPCDCTLGKMGGFAKRATLFKHLDQNKNALIFDTGGTLDNPGYDQVHQILNIISKLDYDLILPSENDKKLMKVAWRRGTKNWLYKTSRFTYTLDGINISILAVSDAIKGYDKNIKYFDLKNVSMSKKLDLDVWLVNLQDEEIKKLLELLSKPDFLIAGPCDWAAPTPDTIMGVPVYRAGVDGIDILELNITSDKNGKIDVIPKWYELAPEIEEDSSIKEMVDDLR